MLIHLTRRKIPDDLILFPDEGAALEKPAIPVILLTDQGCAIR